MIQITRYGRKYKERKAWQRPSGYLYTSKRFGALIQVLAGLGFPSPRLMVKKSTTYNCYYFQVAEITHPQAYKIAKSLGPVVTTDNRVSSKKKSKNPRLNRNARQGRPNAWPRLPREIGGVGTFYSRISSLQNSPVGAQSD